MSKLIVRCSELSKLMTSPRSKSEILSETTKSYVQEKAKEAFYGIVNKIEGKPLEKGIRNEPLAIEMLNQVRFMDYRKHEGRITIEWLTGECDILTEEPIIDVKNSWSFDTFPAFVEEAEKMVKKSGYDWQMRGYCLLYDRPYAEVIYCLTSTPDDLLSAWDDPSVHKVDHIDPEYRITAVRVNREADLEKKMYEQWKIANEYYAECIKELKTKNK